jgi:hypothetical protein
MRDVRKKAECFVKWLYMNKERITAGDPRHVGTMNHDASADDGIGAGQLHSVIIQSPRKGIHVARKIPVTEGELLQRRRPPSIVLLSRRDRRGRASYQAAGKNQEELTAG